MKRLTILTGIACLLFVGTLIAVTRMESTAPFRSSAGHEMVVTSQLATEWARAQGEFLAMDTAFRAIVNTPSNTWTSNPKTINRVLADFVKKRAAFSQKVSEVRGATPGPEEAQVLARLDADLRAYRALTGAPEDATNEKIISVVNAVNQDFDALESLAAVADEREGSRFGAREVNWTAVAALGLSASLVAALIVLIVRRQTGPEAGAKEATESATRSAGALDIINRLSAINSGYGVEKPVQPEPKIESNIEPEPEPDAVPEAKPIPEAKPEPKFEAKLEPMFEAKPEPMVEAKPEPMVEAKLEPKFEAKLEPKFEAKPQPEPKPELSAPLEPHPEEPASPQIDTTINDFTQHTQQLISALFSLNAVADSTMSMVGTLADSLEKSPDRREIEIVATELQTVTAAMLATVQQLSGSTMRMQSQVIHMMKVLNHL